jgi:hypothetical protein
MRIACLLLMVLLAACDAPMRPTPKECPQYPNDPPIQEWFRTTIPPDADACQEWHLLEWWKSPYWKPELP